MGSNKLIVGVNDLQSQFPDIALEAFGWDPKTVAAKSHQKMNWKCKEAHVYSSQVANRTDDGNGCPVCSGHQVLAGFNDLKTKFPHIAAEAYEWDPSTVTAKSGQKKEWKCDKDHIYTSPVSQRTCASTGCPYCSGNQVLKGCNDLKTKFPHIAAEAYEWDPSMVMPGTSKKKEWKCDKNHIYTSPVSQRTSSSTGCPVCSGHQVLAGFNDLKTRFPDIAAEAYEWDPSTVTAKSGQKKEWICTDGHIFSTAVKSRTINGNGCPFCCGHQVLAGFNDLKTRFPDIAAEAYEWDPSAVTAKSNQKRNWMCNSGHIYCSLVSSRTHNDTGCPYCCGQKVLKGFNDLVSQFPDIAAEAYGWDPSTVVAGTEKKRNWKCNEGHIYSSAVQSRTHTETGCPVCSGHQVLAGFNDLKTRFPDIAAEAYEWDPSTVVAGTEKKRNWKCNKGHIYHSTVVGRTSHGNGCPVCAEYGFNPEKDAWFYLMQRPGEQQLGISNVIADRLRTHESNGWTLLEHTSIPTNGQKVLDTEKAFKKWLKEEIGLMEGTTENWSTTKMEVQSLAELKARSGIETDLF